MKGKVLISCRDQTCLEYLTSVLSGVDVAHKILIDDRDFLLEILEHDYPVVIYDLKRDCLNNVKMVRIIKKIRPKISLIVISDDASEVLGGKVLQEGVAYYGVKPINAEMLVSTVSKALKAELRTV